MRGVRLTGPASRALCALLVSGQIALPALANPSGGRVVAGSATIHSASASELEIRQSSARAILDWDSFSIAAGERTHFAQPTADAIALNRVRGGEISELFGTLSADGRVVLVNGAGIHFGPSARVDVGGLIATTADVSDASFLASDRLAFATPGRGAVVNEGLITVRDAGLAALVAPWVENTGTIEARLGTIALASGDTFTLDLAGDSLLEIAVDASAVDGAGRGLSNAGALLADGGAIALISADGARAALDGAINLTGVARALSLENHAGRIVLSAGDDASVRVAGTLDARGAAEGIRGGSITVTGGEIALDAGARIDASGDAGGGEIRVGGDVQGSGTLLRARGLTVASGAELRADALGAGAGGTIVAWSDGHTEFAGALSALGRGDVGGFAEISGHQTLALTGDVALGQGGRLLLDPTEILISDAAGATLSTDTLRRQLIAGTSVDLLATDDIVLASTLDGRVSNGGVAGGAVSFESTNGSILLNADLITNRGAISLDAGVDVVMAPTGGGLSGSAVALVVSNGANGLGTQGVTVRAGGNATLEFLATSGAVDVQATGDLDFRRDLGTLANPIASLVASGAGIDLPASIVTANGAVTISAAANLAMLATDQIFVSNGTGAAVKGTGAIALSYGAGDLQLGDGETGGAIAIDYTGAGSSRVTLTQQLGGGNAPIGGLDIDAPVVDQAQSIVAQGDVRLGRVGAADCSGLTGCTVLRRDIFTRGGAFEVRGDALIDPRRALVDANGNPFPFTPVVGLTDQGSGQGALVFGTPRTVQTASELALTRFDMVPVLEVVNGAADPSSVFPLATRAVTTLVQDNDVQLPDRTTLHGLFPNLRQEDQPSLTSQGAIGRRIDSVWTLTIDTSGGAGGGAVEFAGSVTVPSFASENQIGGLLPIAADGKELQRPPSACNPGPTCGSYFTSQWLSGTYVVSDTTGVSEFVELGIVAGAGSIAFGGMVDGDGILQLNVDSASALDLPAQLTPSPDPGGGASLHCGKEVSCFGSMRVPIGLITTVDPVFRASPVPNDNFPISRVLDESEGTHYAFHPYGVPLPTERRAAWLTAPGLGLSPDVRADVSSGPVPQDVVAYLSPRPRYDTKPSTGTFTSIPASGANRTDTAGSFSFGGGGGGLFGGGAGLGGAGGLPVDDSASIASTSAIEGGEFVVSEEDPATTLATSGCPQSGASAYQATPGQAAFAVDPRGGPFSVDAFCGAYRLVEAADPGGSNYGDLPFVAGDFWSESGFVRESTSAAAAPEAP